MPQCGGSSMSATTLTWSLALRFLGQGPHSLCLEHGYVVAAFVPELWTLTMIPPTRPWASRSGTSSTDSS
jgi:hypothetical protein